MNWFELITKFIIYLFKINDILFLIQNMYRYQYETFILIINNQIFFNCSMLRIKDLWSKFFFTSEKFVLIN